MKRIHLFIHILFVSQIEFGGCQTYNRSLLMKKHPEFEEHYVLFPSVDGEIKLGRLKYSDDQQSRILGFGRHNLEKDVVFTLYTRSHPGGIHVANADELPKYFDVTKKTKFITHGWMSSGTADSNMGIKNGFLNTSDVNVIIMDWSSISDNVFYPIPMKATTDVGRHYAKFLNYLVNELGVNPKDLHLIGHSLGAHVSGFAGRGLVKGKPARITGLDPALPGFDIGLVEGGHLNSNDADFVDIIHTCAGFLGMKQPIGHVDFYPNGGGPPQPGCGILEFVEACSHGRSWKLFVESIVLDKHFMASKCESLQLLESTECIGEEIAIGEPTPLDARGIYYIKTGSKEPYIRDDSKFADNNNIEE